MQFLPKNCQLLPPPPPPPPTFILFSFCPPFFHGPNSPLVPQCGGWFALVKGKDSLCSSQSMSDKGQTAPRGFSATFIIDSKMVCKHYMLAAQTLCIYTGIVPGLFSMVTGAFFPVHNLERKCVRIVQFCMVTLKDYSYCPIITNT